MWCRVFALRIFFAIKYPDIIDTTMIEIIEFRLPDRIIKLDRIAIKLIVETRKGDFD